MHHMFLFGSVALSRVAPIILPLYYEFLGIQYEDIDLKGENGQRLNALLARFSVLVQAADRECESSHSYLPALPLTALAQYLG